MTNVTIPIPNLPPMPEPDLSWVDALPPEALRLVQHALMAAAPQAAQEHSRQVKLWGERQHVPLLDIMLDEYMALTMVDAMNRVMDRAAELGVRSEPDAVHAWAQACQRHYEAP